MPIVRHTVALPEGVPDWIHLVPAGTFHGADGRGPFTLADPAAVIAASMAGGKLAVDENHATDLAAQSGIPSPARGWIVELQSRADGIWGRVEWTPSGTQLMTECAYRGISPVFEAGPKGTVLRILRAALTNTPNLSDLQTLHSQETALSPSEIRTALGLPDTADDAAVLAAIAAGRSAVSAHSQIAAAAGQPETATVAHLVTVLSAQRAGATEVQTMATKIVELQTQVTTMHAAQAKAAAVAFVDGAIKAGAPIAPLRDHYVTRHMADAASVETEIGAMPRLNVGGTAVLHATNPSAGATVGNDLSPSDMHVANKMGLDPKKFAEFKKSKSAGSDGRAA